MMSTVLERIENEKGEVAEILIDKDSNLYRVEISGNRFETLYRNSFTERENARRAIYRHLAKPYVFHKKYF